MTQHSHINIKPSIDHRQILRLSTGYIETNWTHSKYRGCKATLHIALCEEYMVGNGWRKSANVKNKDFHIGSPRKNEFNIYMSKGKPLWTWLHDYTQYHLTGKLEILGFDACDPTLRLGRFTQPFAKRFIELCDEVANTPDFQREIVLNKPPNIHCDNCESPHPVVQSCEDARNEWERIMKQRTKWLRG